MKILSHTIIYRDAAWYATFPCLTRTLKGDLLCGFRRAPREAEGHSHLHSRSRAMFVRSSDDGESWSAPAAICPQDELGQQDPQLATLSNGRMIASFFRWQAHAPTETESVVGLRTHTSKGCLWSNAGVASCISNDHGRTWSDLVRLPMPWQERGGASRAPAVELPGGRLLLPCYGNDGSMTPDKAYLMRSDDQGASWQFHAVMAESGDAADPFQCQEPYVVLTAGGDLICFLRSYGEGGRMRMTRSRDGGESWSPVVETGVWGFPQTALRLTDGRILLAYGHRRAPLGVRARLLDADGANVEQAPEIGIREDGVSTDLGYPTAIQRRDGSILLAYYIHLGDGIRHIAATLLEP